MRAVLRLVGLFSWRYLRRRKLRFLLSGSSVTLGVALFVSARVTHASIVRSFEKTIESLSGDATHQVTRGLGIELAAPRMIEAAGATAAPVIQETVSAPDLGETLLVPRIDFVHDAKLRRYSMQQEEADPAALLFDPNAMIAARSSCERHRLRLGSEIVAEWTVSPVGRRGGRARRRP